MNIKKTTILVIKATPSIDACQLVANSPGAGLAGGVLPDFG
jgi:hypothetical protein